MRLIKIQILGNGAHDNQTINNVDPSTFPIPEGYAVIPEDIVCENFPFGKVTVKEIDGIMTVTKWVAGTIPEPIIDNSAQIAELKAQLSSTDYKIIKCSEAQLVGEELPYDIVALHEERQALRDKINELEGSVQ